MATFVCIYLCLLVVVYSSAKSINDFYRLTKEESEKLQSSCGRQILSKTTPLFRISHGSQAQQGEFPWAVGLFRKGRRWCTGSVISRYHIATAAHCLNYEKGVGLANVNVTKDWYLSAGSPCIFDNYQNYQDAYVNCSNSKYKDPIKLHVKYIIIPRSSLYDNIEYQKTGRMIDIASDLALFELLEPLPEYETDIRPVCVPTPGMAIPRAPLIRSYGFGHTGPGKDDRNNLQLHWFIHRGQMMTDAEMCKKILSLADLGSKKYRTFCQNMIVLFFRKGDPTTSCAADSGGALVGDVAGRQYLFGTLSSGHTFCQASDSLEDEVYRSRFLRVASLHDFICFYAGICPYGYNVYSDKNYEAHPEPVAFLSDGIGKRILRLGDVQHPDSRSDSIQSSDDENNEIW